MVPAAAVPSYAGTSSFLVLSKYNDYAGLDGGKGVNRIAVLDPNETMAEPHASSNGALVMKEILAVAGPTPDPSLFPLFPDAVHQWCINAAAVDPVTGAVMANSEDGKVYRWDLATNTLSQAVTLSPGVGEAYTSTLIGPDGTVYATNQAILDAVGPTVTVTVARAGSGNGGVASDPGGIACGAACSAPFPLGAGAARTTTQDVEAYIQSLMPKQATGVCAGPEDCHLRKRSTTPSPLGLRRVIP